MCTPSPVRALRYAGRVEVRVLPSPVFISAMWPLWRATPPTSCTSKWRLPRVRTLASRTAANASGSRSSRVWPSARRLRKTSVSWRSSASERCCIAGSKALISGTSAWERRSSLPSPKLRTLDSPTGRIPPQTGGPTITRRSSVRSQNPILVTGRRVGVPAVAIGHEHEGGRAEQAGRLAQLAGDDPAGGGEREAGVGGEGLLEGLPEGRAGLGEAADDGGHLEVEQAGAGGDRRAHGPTGPGHVAQGDGVPGGGGGQRDPVGDHPGPGAPALVQGPTGRVGPGRDRLQAAAAAAGADRPVELDHDMAHVAGVAAGSVVEAAVKDEAAADPGGHGHAEQVGGAGPGALPVLAHREPDGVVVDEHAVAGELLGQALAEWEAAPGGHVERGDLARGPDHRPGGGHADAAEVAGEDVGAPEGRGRARHQGLVERFGVGAGR